MTITQTQKSAWLATLRDGSVPQVRHRLREANDGPGRCCLGVLCDQLGDQLVVPHELVHDTLVDVLGSHVTVTCVRWNDKDKLSFLEIADKLETELIIPEPPA